MYKKQAHRSFKKIIDGEDARRRRGDNAISLRKQKREENVQKRRVKNTTEEEYVNLVDNKSNKIANLPQLIEGLLSNEPYVMLSSVQSFRRILSIERNPPIEDVIQSGVVPHFIRLLKNKNEPLLQFEAAWALTNIASGSPRQTNAVIEAGAIPIFAELLMSPSSDVREQAVWALGNIAGDSPVCRDLVLKASALSPLLCLCSQQTNSKLSMLRNATWTLSNLCRGKPQPDFSLVAPALPTLSRLIYSKDEEVVSDACWALSYLSDDLDPNNEKIQSVIAAGVCRRLVELLGHQSNMVKTPALRTVGNIVTGDDIQTSVIINCQALPWLLTLLSNIKRGIRKEACWTISNITAGNSEQIQEVLNANIFPPLIQLLKDSEFEIKKEAAWAISNATSGGTDEQIHHLVYQGCIQPLCALFSCNDPKIIIVAIEGIENILKTGKRAASLTGGPNKYCEHVEECGGLDKLVSLQRHENDDIYQRVAKILRTYFESEEEEDAELAPTTNAQGFVFDMQNPNQQNQQTQNPNQPSGQQFYFS